MHRVEIIADCQFPGAFPLIWKKIWDTDSDFPASHQVSYGSESTLTSDLESASRKFHAAMDHALRCSGILPKEKEID